MDVVPEGLEAAEKVTNGLKRAARHSADVLEISRTFLIVLCTYW